MAALLVAATVGLTSYGTKPGVPGASPGLAPPQGTAVPPPTGAPPSSRPHEIAVGWNRLDLPGNGTIVGLTHGAAGWMALTRGEQATVTTSSDARVWVTRSFPGSLDGEVRSLVGDSQLVVVDSAVHSGGGARSWVSADDARTWDTALFPYGFVRVEALAVAGPRLLAGGASATDADVLLEERGATAAAVWEYSEDGWRPLAFSAPPGRHSEVRALATGPDGVLAFGRSDDTAAAWRLVGSVLVPESISVPRQLEEATFSTVTRSARGWWLAEFKTQSAVSYATSTDLRNWDLLGSGYDGSESTSVAVSVLGIVQVGADDRHFRLVNDSGIQEISYRYPDTVTGFDPDRHTEVVASDGNLIIMGGGTYSPAIWVRGLVGGRVGVTAGPPSQQGRWVMQQAFGPGSRADGPRPFQVAWSDGELVMATPQGVWRTPDPASARPERDGIVADSLIATDRGLLMIDSGSRLLRHEGGGRWVPEDLAITVRGATGASSSVIVYGWNDRGEPTMAISDAGGGWEVVPPDPASTVHPVAAAGGLVFGFDPGTSPRDGGRVTADGVTWDPLEVGGLRGVDNGIPFLVAENSSNSTTIELLDDRSSITVPTIDPLEVVRVGRIVRVRGSDGLWETADDGATWTSYPIGVEHRLTGPVRLIPTEQPMLLMAERDSYQIFAFVP